MKDRFPRTPEEFEEHGRVVRTHCDCGVQVFVPLKNLVQRFGPDFDLFTGYAEVRDALPCDQCGRLQTIVYAVPSQMTMRPITYEESLASSLELGAFVTARDAAAAGVSQEEWLRQRREQKVGRVRRFGRRGR